MIVCEFHLGVARIDTPVDKSLLTDKQVNCTPFYIYVCVCVCVCVMNDPDASMEK